MTHFESRPATTHAGYVATGGELPPPTTPGRGHITEALDWARSVIADVQHHDDATILEACEVIAFRSPDPCDRLRAQGLRQVLEGAA